MPLNRIVAFLGPYISAIAGVAAAWLVAKVNIVGLPGLDEHNVATLLSFLLTQGVVTVVTWLGQQQWLKGHHIQLAGDAQVQAAAIAKPAPPLDVDPAYLGDELDDELEPGEDLVSDEEEFAAPPPADPAVVQPSQAGIVQP